MKSCNALSRCLNSWGVSAAGWHSSLCKCALEQDMCVRAHTRRETAVPQQWSEFQLALLSSALHLVPPCSPCYKYLSCLWPNLFLQRGERSALWLSSFPPQPWIVLWVRECCWDQEQPLLKKRINNYGLQSDGFFMFCFTFHACSGPEHVTWPKFYLN